MDWRYNKTMQKSHSSINKVISLVLMLIMVFTIIAVSVSAQDEPDPTDEDAFAAILGLIIVCMIIALVIAIVLAVWIYKDAEKRGKSGIMWVIFLIIGGVVFNFIGVIAVIIIWLLIRGPEFPPGMPYPYPPMQPGYPPQQPYYPPPQPPYYPPPQQPPPY
jgi:NhaP-type Na+/H+ or K+/H+ antiporter